MAVHLWEVEHPYYCETTNYFKSGCHHEHRSWPEFARGFSTDMDLNLLFRFDWEEPDDVPFNGDEHYRNGTLLLFFMGQRNGAYTSHAIEVCRADEPAVLEWLRPRFERMMKLWEPLSTPGGSMSQLEDERTRLREALRHVGHYLESPASYSKEEFAFVAEIVNTEGRCLSEAGVESVPETEILGQSCIDGGTCHHGCEDRCFRRESCGPLSGYDGPWEYDTARQNLREIVDRNPEDFAEPYEEPTQTGAHLRDEIAEVVNSDAVLWLLSGAEQAVLFRRLALNMGRANASKALEAIGSSGRSPVDANSPTGAAAAYYADAELNPPASGAWEEFVARKPGSTPVATLQIDDLEGGTRGLGRMEPDDWWVTLPSGTYHVYPAAGGSARHLDWSGFDGPRRNTGWTPSDQDLIYTAVNYRDDNHGDRDEDAGKQIVERLLAAWKTAEEVARRG